MSAAPIKRPPERKMWLAVRADVPMTRFKLAVQAMHAAHWLTLLIVKTRPDLMDAYCGGPLNETEQPTTGTPKIVVKAKNLHALDRIEREARAAGIPVVSVTDQGRTEFDNVPTKTVVLFGPAFEHKLPKYLGGLQKFVDPISDASPNLVSA